MTSLFLSLVMAASATVQSGAAKSPNPPIHLSLSSDAAYYPGDRARVHIRAEEDGYVAVLRTDVDGQHRGAGRSVGHGLAERRLLLDGGRRRRCLSGRTDDGDGKRERDRRNFDDGDQRRGLLDW